jgi:hypothetical protein
MPGVDQSPEPISGERIKLVVKRSHAATRFPARRGYTATVAVAICPRVRGRRPRLARRSFPARVAQVHRSIRQLKFREHFRAIFSASPSTGNHATMTRSFPEIGDRITRTTA